MNLLNLIENTTAGYDNLRALMQAVQNSQDAVLNIGGDPVTLEYPEARFMLGKYRAYNKAGRQEEFLRDLADPVRFDLHMKQLRDLIAKQKNFRGSVPGQRGVTGDVPAGVMEGLDSLDEIALQDPENMTTETYGKLNWENMLRAYMDNRPYAEFEFGKSSSPLTLYRNQIYAILKAFGNMKPQQKVNIILSVFGDKMATVEYLDKLRQKGRIPKVAPFYKSPDATPVSPQQMELPGMPAPRIKEASAQKKNSDKPEFDRTTAVNPKVQRAFQLARARQAASGSDIEAFVKDELEKAEQAQAEIEQLKQDNEAQDQQIRQLAAKVAQQDQTISQPAEPEVSTPAEPTGRVEPKKAEEPKADQPEPKRREEPKGQAEPKRREEPRAEPARVPKPEKPQAQKPPKPPKPPKPQAQKPPKPQRPPKPEPEVPDNVIQGPWGQPGTVPQDDDIAAAISGIDIPMTGTYGGIQRVKEDTQELHVGDPVIIQGNVEFKGKTGDIAGFGRDKHFVIVDLYNFGKHAFHASNVAYNDYADQADYVDEMQTKIDRSNISRPILPSGAAKLKYAQDHNMYDDARIQEALPDKAMAVLRGLKQTPQAQTAEPVSPQKQAELDQWAQDFQRNVADKFGKQVVTPAQQPAIDLNVPVPKKRGRPSNIQRDLERSEYAKIKQQIAQLDELIKMKELIDKLFLKAQNVRGGIYPGLQSDIEDEEMYGVPQTDQEFAALKDKYTRDLAALQKFLAMKKAMYREGQDRVSESASLVRLQQARQQLAQQGMAEGSLEEIDRRGFLKGMGAAAVAGATGNVTAQSTDSPTEFANYAARLATSSIKDGLPMIARMTGGDNVQGGWFNHVYPNIHQMILWYCTNTNSYNARQVIDSANRTALQASGITEITPGRNFANQINVFMSTYRGEILQAVKQYETQSTQKQHEKSVMGNLNKEQFDTLLDALLIYAICKDRQLDNTDLFRAISSSIRRFIDTNNAKDYVNSIYPKAQQSVEMLKRNPELYQKESADYFKNAGTVIQKLDTISRQRKPEFENIQQSVKEAQTDYQKRRQRERDVEAGKPVAKQRQSKMTDYQKKRAQDKKDMELGEQQMCPECGGPSFSDLILAEKQDACYHKVRSRYKVWPSAYASGALVQCRKKGAANWGNKDKK